MHLPASPLTVSDLTDQPFDPRLTSTSSGLNAVIAFITREVEEYELATATRTRRRKVTNQAIFEAAIFAIICNLARHHLQGLKGGVTVPRSRKTTTKKSRYKPPILGKSFPDVLDALERLGIIEQRLGSFKAGRQTVIRAAPSLIAQIEAAGLQWTEVTKGQPREVIILKRPRKGHWDKARLMDYDDNDVTERLRREMLTINEWLSDAEIRLADATLDDTLTAEVSERFMRRYFTLGRTEFDSGGRLFGGFWQDLRKDERLRRITIGGSPVVELDYGQVAPRILYGMAGATAPSEDLYAIPGYEHWREGMKKVLGAMMFVAKPLKRKPNGTADLLPKAKKISEIQAAIEATHLPIKHLFYREIGHRAQFVESTILLEVLLTLRSRGIVALPIHDALLVARQYVDEAEHVMLEVFRRHAGVEGSVNRHAPTIDSVPGLAA